MVQPRKELENFNYLVGKWKILGNEVKGEVEYKWMDGGHFLIQTVKLEQYGQSIQGFEVIGFENGFGQVEPSVNITSRFFDSEGNTFDYTYEIDQYTLTIWGGSKGSPAYYKGEWSEDFTRNVGAWVYPEGGGYESTMEKIL